MLNTDACRRCYDGGIETHVAHFNNSFTVDQCTAAALLSRRAVETAAAALLSRRADETAAAAPLPRGADETAAAALLTRGADETRAQGTANGSAPTRARRINNDNCG